MIKAHIYKDVFYPAILLKPNTEHGLKLISRSLPKQASKAETSKSLFVEILFAIIISFGIIFLHVVKGIQILKNNYRRKMIILEWVQRNL